MTNGFSKKIENHEHSISLHYMYYNFCRVYQTLTKQAGGIRKTPAMTAGVTDHVWKLEEVVGLLEEKEAGSA